MFEEFDHFDMEYEEHLKAMRRRIRLSNAFFVLKVAIGLFAVVAVTYFAVT